MNIFMIQNNFSILVIPKLFFDSLLNLDSCQKALVLINLKLGRIMLKQNQAIRVIHCTYIFYFRAYYWIFVSIHSFFWRIICDYLKLSQMFLHHKFYRHMRHNLDAYLCKHLRLCIMQLVSQHFYQGDLFDLLYDISKYRWHRFKR